MAGVTSPEELLTSRSTALFENNGGDNVADQSLEMMMSNSSLTTMTNRNNEGAPTDSSSNWIEARPIDEVQELLQELHLGPDGPFPRAYEVMSKLGGKIRFRCAGRCIAGPSKVDTKFYVSTWIAIATPTGFYFSACTPEITDISSIFEITSFSQVLPLLTFVLLMTTVILLLFTSHTDPGIIPRYAMRLLVEGLEEEVARSIGCEGLNIDIVYGTNDESILQTLAARGYRWCSFCRMIQPPRATHCRDCDCCILRNDHHCPFVNNCIGQRNYVHFCGFLLSLVCLNIAVFSGIGLWAAGDGNATTVNEITGSIRTAILCVLIVPATVFLVGIVGLSIFHAVLICRGRTTREVLKGRQFGEGATLFGERGPSLISARHRIRVPPFAVGPVGA
jgi:hypothetical protein